MTINISEVDGIPNEELYINYITFYGLYGYPDSFVIDKGKRYKVEDDTSNNRRISNKNEVLMSYCVVKWEKKHEIIFEIAKEVKCTTSSVLS